MTSQINPQNIDGAYPVAGQDNDSQGFRDNFTNTKTNFEYASAEITDLQNKAVLKAALTGQTLNNDMGGSVLSNARLQDMAETKVDRGSVSTSAVIDYAAGSYYTLSTNGSIILSFTGWPAAGFYGRCRVQVYVSSTSDTVTFTAGSNWINGTGIAGGGASGTNLTLSFPATGYYEYEFETTTAGSTITVNEVNKNIQPFNNSSEDLANGATINVNVTTSYFTTGGAETATLPSAPSGMIKVLYARNVSAGNMVVTVSSGAAWGGAGTITFSATGQACTLMSTGGGWVCIGNNGAVFG